MRKWVWLGTALALAAAALGWYQYLHLQLARATHALAQFPAPHSLYWPGQAARPNALSALDHAAALASIARAIESAEARLGPTPQSVYLRGRLAAIRGSTAEAIRQLYLASLLDPDDANFQMAYGVSLAVRAGSENRAIDWATAADALLQASEMPGFPASGFADLAEVSAKLPAPQAAIDYWKKAASLADSAERPVFEQRLHHAEAEMRTRRERAAQVMARREADPDVPGSAELLLQTALSDWLPRRDDFAKDLVRLAVYFQRQLHDPALHDLLAAPPNPAADRALARASQANTVGEYRAAADAAIEAGKLYRAAGNVAGQVFAGVQSSYGLRRGGRAKECPAVADHARRLAGLRGYRWAELRAWQEATACKARQRVIDLLVERDRLAARSIGSGFLDLEMRGASSLVEPSRGFTAPVESWQRGQQGLVAYWRSVMPAPYAVNFYSPLGLMAESFGYSHLAKLLFRENMAVMDGHPNQWLRAAIRSDFLRLDPGAKLPGTATSEIEQASWDLAAGKTDEALARLRHVIKGEPFPYPQLDHYDRITLLPVMGRALWQKGRRDEALRHYRVLIDDNIRAVSALKGRRQRLANLLEVGPSWRLLVEAQLEMAGASAALETWQTFRTLAKPGQTVELSPPPGEGRLAVALLPAGPVVWWADAQGVAVQRISRQDLTRRAQRFAALVANPGSPLAVVQEGGRELYDLLIAPFEQRLSGVRTLVVDPDGTLAVLPWGALRDREGRSLLSRLAVVQTIGWGSPAIPRPDLDRGDWQPALVVAEPAVAQADRARFPVLPAARAEAEHLRTLFPRNLYLAGPDARIETLQQQLTRHRLFHFAGHGVANGGNGALVLAGEPLVGTRLITAAEIGELDLRVLRLATLAACSSAAGEDRGAVNVESLVQAFLDAGTGQVLAGRWSVDSHATSRVMQRFYQRLKDGATPAAALRDAALGVAGDPREQHPYYWAAFQVFGRDRP
jgi:CHAT domain-containing protein